jgi:hypothetical protein
MAYSNAQYGQAIEVYQSLIDEGFHDPRLYFNLGDAYFKQGQLGKSILYFERAYLLDPSDIAIQQNLQIAKARTRDRVDPIPLLFIVQWWNDIKTHHSVETLFVYSVILVWLLALTIFIFFGFKRVLVRRIALGLGLALGALFVASVVIVQDKNEDITAQRNGIILPVEVSVSSAPDRSGVDAFIVHEGLKVEVLEQRNDRLHIRLADGKQGWIDKHELARI